MSAFKRVAEFSWDGVFAKVKDESVRKSLNHLRGRSNEIVANAQKNNNIAPIDFSAYKNKLKFTAAGVDKLQKLYESKSLPTYTANVPALEKKRRDEMVAIAEATVAAANEDLALLNKKVEDFEKVRVSAGTTVQDLYNRFPDVATEVEANVEKQRHGR